MKKILVSGALLLAVVISLVVAANAQRILGGYRAIPTDDARVKEAADFAVSKRSEEQEGLNLVSIEKAETQSVAGFNVRLCMTVSLDEESQQIKAVVYKNLQSVFSLTSWDVVESCGGSATSARSSASAPMPNKIYNCTGSQLSLAGEEGDSDIGGKRYWNYVFTNISSKPCLLSGYPKFALLNRSGAIMRTGIEYTNDYPNSVTQAKGKRSSSVRLEPGKKAWFQIYFNDGMALEHTKPYPVAHKVRVTAPNDTRRFMLKSDIQTCCGVQVSSFRKGSPK